MKKLKQQIQAEYDNSAAYLSIAYWAEVSGYQGLTQFCRRSSLEEQGHAKYLADFLVNFKNEKLGPIANKMLSVDFTSLLEAVEFILELELSNTAKLEQLSEDSDICLRAYVYPMLIEQVKSVSEVQTMLSQLRNAEDPAMMDYIFYSMEATPVA